MSFDLYFVSRPAPATGWDHVMDELEAAAAEERTPTPDDIALWDRVVAAVLPLMPNAEVLDQGESRQVDNGTSIQLTMSPGEISINSPYWFEGPESERVVQQLREVSAAIEKATGLVAYDPQADAAFLEYGAEHAAGTFDRIHEFIETDLGGRPAKAPKKLRPFWRRK